MTLTQLKFKFKDTLKGVYPNTEITSIFRMLVQQTLNLDSAEIVLEGNKELKPNEFDYFENALNRLQHKEPIQYILGKTTFFDLKFIVTPDVLIPRPETEELVQWVINDIQKQSTTKTIRILDIGTGSGCIAISLAKNIQYAEVSAIDISENALLIAKENAKNNDVTIQLIHNDVLELDQLTQTYDIIVSNPPYVRELEKAQMHDNVLKFEPKEALFVYDENPLLFYNKICDLAKEKLVKNGCLYFEINQYMGKEMLELIKSKGFKNFELRKDFLGKDRMVKAIIN